MKRLITLLLSMLFVFSCTSAFAQDWVKKQLNESPRHLEWVDVKQGERKIKCFIAYPEKKEKATSVVVIHEIFGLSDWVRNECDDLAKDGFIAIAPDLLSGKPGEDSSKYTGNDDVRTAIRALPREQVAADLKAVADYVSHLPSASGKVAVTGFCWGGSQTWLALTTNPELKAGYVFYGSLDESLKHVDKITAPVYGFYGEQDARVSATVPATTAAMEKAKRSYTPKIYPGAKHGFMREGEGPDKKGPDKEARDDAWSKLIESLKKI
jgi:carboxymethylenebutenolidase